MAKTSIYLNKERTAAIESCGHSLLELIDVGLAAEKVALYLLHDQDDDLLYAGITRNLSRRFSEHAIDKPWWPGVARKTIEWFGSRKDAEAAERAAIATLAPRYNRNGGIGTRGQRTSVYLSEELAASVKADGRPLAELIRAGLAALQQSPTPVLRTALPVAEPSPRPARQPVMGYSKTRQLGGKK